MTKSGLRVFGFCPAGSTQRDFFIVGVEIPWPKAKADPNEISEVALDILCCDWIPTAFVIGPRLLRRY